MTSRVVFAVDWEDLLASDVWAEQVASPWRKVASRVEVIDPRGQSLGDAVIDSGTVRMVGGGTEMWAADVAGTDPDWLPIDQTDLLDSRSGNRVRIWWQEWMAAYAAWVEVPLMTGWPHNPKSTDTGGLSWSLTVRDSLQEAKRGGYGGATVELGGLTVDKALAALFTTVAPLLDYDFPVSDVLLPATFTLGENAPDKDWVDIAAVAGWHVWTDRLGVIKAGPVVPGLEIDWSEGDGCRLTEIDRQVTTTELKNKIVVRSSNTEIAPAIVGISEDDDPSSPTYTGTHGPWVLEVESDAIATQEDADRLADTLLAVNLVPATQITAKATPRPDIDYADVVTVERDQLGIFGPHSVQSWQITLPQPGTAPELMQIALSPGFTVGQGEAS